TRARCTATRRSVPPVPHPAWWWRAVRTARSLARSATCSASAPGPDREAYRCRPGEFSLRRVTHPPPGPVEGRTMVHRRSPRRAGGALMSTVPLDPEARAERRTYVLDTSVLLADALALERFDGHDVVLPLVVLSELEAKRH